MNLLHASSMLLGRWLAVLAVVVTAATMPSRAEGVLVTLVDGDAVITDGVQRLAAKAGARIAAGALVDTSPGALVQLEYDDDTVVDLGPATRAMVLPPGFRPRSGRPPALYLLQGWAKIVGRGSAPAGGVVAPRVELLPLGGTAVVYTGTHEQAVFAESGSLDLIERGTAVQRGLAPGALFGIDGVVVPRPPADWLQRVPRPFRDPIPRRAAAFKDKPVDASVLPPPTYGELADWLAAEPDVRRDFPRRFATLTQNADFRRAVKALLPAHPEWAAVLGAVR